MSWYLPLALLIFFELVADVLAKQYSLRPGWIYWLASLLGYVVANIFWLQAIRNGSGLARGAIIFSVATAVIAAIIGLLIYQETMSWWQVVGLLLGIISLALLG